ncbi:hypothetical protein [Streptomyces ureilyticus]|uniref:Uncharacterized protein n=1 Tax=Streptomyces ureilyticus TaxID=1775131 RepID=A0ABX0EAC8_9ACTN|nr:hypothetical protein [Streptomyces ureilyticus]NGO48992.1 hypothetical protein [Streptomyces ureilyticus]
MATTFPTNGRSDFRIKRPTATNHDFVSETDGTVARHLAELDKVLNRRIFSTKPTSGSPAKGSASGSTQFQGMEILKNRLTPRRAVKVGGDFWATGSLVDKFLSAPEDKVSFTLLERIDATPVLSELRYAFDEVLAHRWRHLGFNMRAVLDTRYPAIRGYLIAFGFHVMKLNDAKSLTNFLLNNPGGVKTFIDYAVVSAARTLIFEEQLKVPQYDKDDSDIVSRLIAAGLPLSSPAFQHDVDALVDDFIYNGKWHTLIKNADIGVIKPAMLPQLVKYLKNSPVEITAKNINYFLPLFITQISGGIELEDDNQGDRPDPDREFNVEFLTDDREQAQVSSSAVKCAAQLFYTMVLGDELQVFGAVDYFTRRYLMREGFDIEDNRLRADLQMYVFSNKFTVTDTRTNLKRVLDRTEPAERQLFYRKVFDQGSGTGQVPDDLIVNDDFPQLWKVLMLESARYLERAQLSPHPANRVSPQGVMQAVEDLRYNLSLRCTGMATVMTPLIDDELDFVTRRILMHREVLTQLAPSGGTWWKVVEKLHLEMNHARPRATVLQNKAQGGYNIIRAIADYDPAVFEKDENFSAFISEVEAFITTQSILQEALADDLKEAARAAAPTASPNGSGYGPRIDELMSPGQGLGFKPDKAGAGAGAPQDEWDF